MVCFGIAETFYSSLHTAQFSLIQDGGNNREKAYSEDPAGSNLVFNIQFGLEQSFHVFSDIGCGR